MENKYSVTKAVVGGIAAFIVLIFVLGSFTVVSVGQRGVVLRVGSLNRILEDGIHFKVPIFESVYKVSVQTQKEQVQADAASQDLQTVKAVVAVNYNVDPGKVSDLYTTVGVDYKVRVIDPAIQESIKAATAKYTAEQLITQRPKVKDDILSSLKAILAPKDIQVSDVSITQFDFSDSFNAAIEAKVTAEQQALQAKNKLEQVQYEAQQTVATAKAQAEAIRIQAEAITQQGGANYVQLKAIEKWKGDVPTYMMGNATPFINLTK